MDDVLWMMFDVFSIIIQHCPTSCICAIDGTTKSGLYRFAASNGEQVSA